MMLRLSKFVGGTPLLFTLQGAFGSCQKRIGVVLAAGEGGQDDGGNIVAPE